jgi:CRISPR-associated protein Cas2
MLVVVVYDIPDDKRRLRLANFLEGHGRRVQYSVFECFMELEEMRELHKRVETQINLDEDNVRFYWLAPEAVKNSLTLGSPPPQEPPNLYIF